MKRLIMPHQLLKILTIFVLLERHTVLESLVNAM